MAFRRHVTNRFNAPLRRQLTALIPDGSRVLEIGCADGRLLLDAGPRLKNGLGIDLDQVMIAAARETAKQSGLDHIRFAVADARCFETLLPFRPDVAVASLCLHEMPRLEAVALLRRLTFLPTLLIADLVTPSQRLRRALLELDERCAGHFDRYRDYRDAGGMPALLADAGIQNHDRMTTADPAIGVWVCKSA